MFLPIPQGLPDLPAPQAQVSPAALVLPTRPAKAAPPAPAPAPARNRDRDVRFFQAVRTEDVHGERKRALFAEEQAKLLGKAQPRPPAAWYEDPIALGSILLLCPPIGLAALWSSKRYSSDARWALTIMTALTLCLAGGLGIALMLARG